VKLKKIADLDISVTGALSSAMCRLTNDAKGLITDPDIDIVVELIGGYKPAKEFILEAIKNKKHVVTANKALLARSRRGDLCRRTKGRSDRGL